MKTKDYIDGSNWINRSKINCMGKKAGGDYHSSSYVSWLQTMPNYTFTFEDGDEDILLDVTEL